MDSGKTPGQKLADRVDALNEWCGNAVSWLVMLMVCVMFLIVVLRYVFSTGWIALQESVGYMHAVVFLVGAAYTLKHEGHVRVDVFYADLAPRSKAWIDLAGTLLFLMPVCMFLFWISWDYVAVSWATLEGSRETGGLPGVFLLKSFILVMAGLLLLQGIAMVLRAWLLIRKPPGGDEGHG